MICHCQCFAGPHEETRRCEIIKNLQRKAVQEMLNAPIGWDDDTDRRLDERANAKYINQLNRNAAK